MSALNFAMFILVSIIAFSHVSAQVETSRVCMDLGSLYSIVPQLLATATEKDCGVDEERQCFIIKGLLMEKSRERVYNMRAALKCIDAPGAYPINVPICHYLIETSEKATKLVKEVFPVPFNRLAIHIANIFQKELATVLEPIIEQLCM